MRRLVARSLHSLLPCLFLFLVLSPSTSFATPINVTVDDLDTSVISYAPSNGWANGQDCSGCALTHLVNASQVLDGSWHDSTYHSGNSPGEITATFIGTAVYVFNIIANNAGSGVTTATNLTFYIDNQLVNSFTHTSDGTANLIYRDCTFANSSLSNEEHFLRIVNGGGPEATLILFDYIIYTTEDDTTTTGTASSTTLSSRSITTSSVVDASTNSTTAAVQPTTSESSPTPIGAIVGGVVGGVGGLVVLSLAALCCIRRRNARQPEDLANKIEPFVGARPGASQAHPQPRRFSRPPALPSLRLGRTRLMPGPGSSVSGSTASEFSYLLPVFSPVSLFPPLQRFRRSRS